MPPRVPTFAELPDLVLRSRIPEDRDAAVIGVAAGFADLVAEQALGRARGSGSDGPVGAPLRSVSTPSPTASRRSPCSCSSNANRLPQVAIGPHFPIPSVMKRESA
jgi:hypothetical protein